ncbi:hypothetical protein M9H77_23034 [Catharanthus roseus]|uniref:Uncharacterized protein n=1 Tax=Catharanthus roseus TaxID=4058 RepID=A0ACC0ASU5_CATRO|nr:hypothetical protein M9H77_23034 [Catharanthus roseus]
MVGSHSTIPDYLPPTVSSKPTVLGRPRDLRSFEDYTLILVKISLIMYIEAQLPTRYSERTSESSHSNLETMKVIMQELQLMRKDMKEMRGNITNLFVEHRDQSNTGGHFTSHTQWGYGNFSPHARSYEHNSNNCYDGNKLGAKMKENGIATNQDLNLMKQALRSKFGVKTHEGQRQGQARVKLMEPSIVDKAPKNKELPQAKLEIEESLETHVLKETSNEDSCDNMNEKSIEKEECSKFKEREIVEEKERVDEYYVNFANYSSCVLGIEDKGKSIEKELGICLQDLSIIPFLNASLSFHDVSFEELKYLLVSYTIYVDTLGDICVISFDGNVPLLVPSMSKCLSSYVSFEDSLMGSGAIFDPFCNDFGILDDASFVDSNVAGFELECALVDILHNRCVSSHDSLKNQLMVSDDRDFLLMGFGNQKETYFEMCKDLLKKF